MNATPQAGGIWKAVFRSYGRISAREDQDPAQISIGITVYTNCIKRIEN